MKLASVRSSSFVFTVVLAVPLPARQAAPPAPAGPRPAPGFTLTIPAWPDGDDIPLKYTQAVPVAGVAGHVVDQRAGRHAQLRRCTSTIPDVSINQRHRHPGPLAGVGHSRHRHEPRPRTCRRGRSCPDGGSPRSAPRARIYRGPGMRAAAGPKHHYTFELYALDATIDVPHGRQRGRRPAPPCWPPSRATCLRQGRLHRALQAAQ